MKIATERRTVPINTERVIPAIINPEPESFFFKFNYDIFPELQRPVFRQFASDSWMDMLLQFESSTIESSLYVNGMFSRSKNFNSSCKIVTNHCNNFGNHYI